MRPPSIIILMSKKPKPMEENKIIYLDNASTTKVNDKVLQAYIDAKKNFFANPSSIHVEGVRAQRALDEARNSILFSLKLKDKEVIFLSGATEGNALALKGVANRYKNRGNHIITSNVEHPSVLKNLEQLEKNDGFKVTYLPVNEEGKINLDDLQNAITKDTILVSLMAVNNESGAINDIRKIGLILKEYPKIIFHVDATQAIGKENIDYQNADLITFSGHKIHGLNGTGALIKNKNIELYPLIDGGGQENNYRSGTNDVAGAISLALALKIALDEQKETQNHVALLYKELYQYIDSNKEEYIINSPKDGSGFIFNFSLLKKKASVVVEALSNNKIMVSSTSACHSKKENKSEIIYRMFNDESRARNTIRVSFSNKNNLEEINRLISELERITKEVKNR